MKIQLRGIEFEHKSFIQIYSKVGSFIADSELFPQIPAITKPWRLWDINPVEGVGKEEA